MQDAATKPIAIDLYCGLGGWASDLLAEGYDVTGYDIEAHDYGTGGYPGKLILQDVTTLHGSQFKDAALLVPSPPCQKYSYMAMPWSRAKAQAAAIEADATGEAKRALNLLFDTCFRLQREASEAAGHHIPLVVENVRGAQKWVGQAAGKYGSFYLWGDVPALMPPDGRVAKIGNPMGLASKPGQISAQWRAKATHHITDGIKQAGISGVRANGKGDKWFQDGAARHGSRSSQRKMASAMIAKIPLALAQHIAWACYPRTEVAK